MRATAWRADAGRLHAGWFWAAVVLAIHAGAGCRGRGLRGTDEPQGTAAASTRPPAWVEGAVIYGIIPPLYGSPPLNAVTRSLDSLDDLGIAAIWLAPIFEAPDDDYGYAVIDPFRVRDSYGTERDLQRLVEQAHARGIRVLLDLVPNHTSDRHPYFLHAQRFGPRSPYFSFYDRDASGHYTYYFDWEHLPNLNYEHPGVVRYTIASAVKWMAEARVDGYRVDVAWGVRRRKPAFWPEFRRRLEQVSARPFLLAEASARDPYYFSHGFDAAYDWTQALGRHAWEDVFDSPDGIAQRLHRAITAEDVPLQRVFRFLNNNDTGRRFIAEHGEPLTRVATALLLTLPGVPCLFMFDEVGAEFLPYQQAQPVAHEDPALRAYHQRLIALRRRVSALHGAGFLPLHVGRNDEAYVYARTADAGGGAALVALNFSRDAARVPVQLPVELRGRRLRDVLEPSREALQGGGLTLVLAPYDAQIWMPAANARQVKQDAQE